MNLTTANLLNIKNGMLMQKYSDIDNDSNVDGFEIGESSIKVKFSNGHKIYVYTYLSAGPSNIETMKRLALSGDGLNTYINKSVRKKFAHTE